MKVERTTFECEGIHEPCIMVTSSDGYTQVRISKCYHYIGKNSLYVREILDGEFNKEDELIGDFDNLTNVDAMRIAKEYSVYL